MKTIYRVQIQHPETGEWTTVETCKSLVTAKKEQLEYQKLGQKTRIQGEHR